jgi:tetratricopeptide (TPR) repeat protein
LDLRGATEEAADKYRYVIEQATERSLQSPDDKSLIGWCLYRLGQYAQATHVLEDGLMLDASMLSTWFDLALVQMCGAQYGIALGTYQQALDRIRSEHGLKRRGLIYIALDDLRQAIREHRIPEAEATVQQAVELLEASWNQVKDAAP